jgi:hypothetical protein
MLIDIQIDAASYDVVKLDMVYENSKDLKLEVPLDDTTLALWDAVTRRVQWRWTFIEVDPSAAAASALTTTSQPNTAPTSKSPETRLSPYRIREEPCLYPILKELCPSPIQEQSHKSLI